MMTLRTLTQDETIAIYGDPFRFLRDDGTIDPAWQSYILASIPIPTRLPLSWDPTIKVGRLRCHHKIAASLQTALYELHANHEAWATIGDFGGCYEFRPRRGSKKQVLSKHSWGLAVDLDVRDNPDHSAGIVHPATIEVFARNGFYWGGNFSGDDRDPMHFEKGITS